MGDDIVDIVQETNDTIDMFDLSSFVLKPEAMQDIFQEIYMELIPKELRHIMGEYFSPDWIVEHVLDMVGFDGENIESTLIDPTCGSGTFITQALKRIIDKKMVNYQRVILLPLLTMLLDSISIPYQLLLLKQITS